MNLKLKSLIIIILYKTGQHWTTFPGKIGDRRDLDKLYCNAQTLALHREIKLLKGVQIVLRFNKALRQSLHFDPIAVRRLH